MSEELAKARVGAERAGSVHGEALWRGRWWCVLGAK